MEPIATYEEQRFDGKRRFELFEDRVVVSGKTTFTSEFESVVPLTTLRPEFTRMRLRNLYFYMGIFLTAGAWLLVAVVPFVAPCRVSYWRLRVMRKRSPGMKTRS